MSKRSQAGFVGGRMAFGDVGWSITSMAIRAHVAATPIAIRSKPIPTTFQSARPTGGARWITRIAPVKETATHRNRQLTRLRFSEAWPSIGEALHGWRAGNRADALAKVANCAFDSRSVRNQPRPARAATHELRCNMR